MKLLFRTFCLTAWLWTMDATAQVLKINGGTTPNVVVSDAAEVLRKKYQWTIHVDTQGGSSGGIAQLGEGRTQMGMTSKPITEEDRKRYPKVNFVETKIGADAVALIVAKDVWDNGVRSITAQQMRDIYEGKIKNWQELGGLKAQRIVFFNKEPGRGTWENFANWLYGSAKNAPSVHFPEVGSNEETRSKVASTRGAISQLSASWVDQERVFALQLQTEYGLIEPSLEEVSSGRYPMSRNLYVITDGEPQGQAKVMVDYLLSAEGQSLVSKHGYLPVIPAKAL